MNVAPEIFELCVGEYGVDAITYQALRTSIDIDGMLDLIEMRNVSESWTDALTANAERQAER